MNETRIFWQTSEFWVMVLTNLLAVAAQLTDFLPPQYGLPLQAGVNAAYMVARGIAKAGVPPQRGG